MTRIQALIFDKDGTLFDFDATWNNWTLGVIHHFSGGDAARTSQIADGIGFDLSQRRFRPDSPIIAGTNREAAELLAAAAGHPDASEVERYLSESTANAPLAEAVPLRPLMTRLRSAGLKLCVATNDSESGARAHLAAADCLQQFDFVAGYDSGLGCKPAPDPLIALAAMMSVPIEACAMIGDSLHDLQAGQRAGMTTIGVLTGPASHDALSPHTDHILPDIGHLPDWLALT
ncbi:HAD family hydrolase [Cognatishimia maritima]|uniref:phosphoglycolate phosphatase n=1 Tax=Cognatishimia maritima TaxID=870908 RepID=A0A1M5UCM8_9RHOB|nr:HAD family hydrolase [Cognatishimia maritima]SHH60586.1 phosphoglycolate phosphatase [Cognatishimia maritima]